jgi:hypothetical protein
MKTSPRHRRPARFAVLALAASVGLLGGCFGNSTDSYPYVSRTFSPKTIVLVDTRTSDELWRYDLGVGNSMKISFHEGDEDNIIMPDEMRWSVKSGQSDKVIAKGEMPCPPEGVRRIDWYERPTPEYPRPEAPEAEPTPLPEPVEAPAEEPAEDPAEEPTEG